MGKLQDILDHLSDFVVSGGLSAHLEPVNVLRKVNQKKRFDIFFIANAKSQALV